MYTLIKTAINTKSAKYRYDIVDETGKVVSSRKTHREYVAALGPHGDNYFGRVDLVQSFLRTWFKHKDEWTAYWSDPKQYTKADPNQTPEYAASRIAKWEADAKTIESNIAYTKEALLEQLIGSK